MDRNITKDKFLSKAGISKGYSLKMFGKIYDALMSELICVEDTFGRFYKLEYDKLERYLYKRYNIPMEVIDEFMEKKVAFPNSAIYRWYALSYGDSSITQFVFSEPMSDRVADLLLLK